MSKYYNSTKWTLVAFYHQESGGRKPLPSIRPARSSGHAEAHLGRLGN
jgi:hypothetical protein